MVSSVFFEVKEPRELDADGGDPNVSESMQASLELIRQEMVEEFAEPDNTRYVWNIISVSRILIGCLKSLGCIRFSTMHYPWTTRKPRSHPQCPK